MEITVKLFDVNQLSDNGRRYENLAEIFEQFKEYMKRKDRYVLEPEENYNFLDHPIRLEQIVGEVEHIEWKDQKLYGKVKLLDTPRGKIYQNIVQELPNCFTVEPFFSYHRLGDKLLGIQLEDMFIMPKKKEVEPPKNNDK